MKLIKNLSSQETYFKIEYFIRGTNNPQIILSTFGFYSNLAFMNITRVILCVIFPPLAVIDKGCGSIVIITVLTMIGWVPGVIGALVILNRDDSMGQKFENSAVITFLMFLILILIAILISYVLFR